MTETKLERYQRLLGDVDARTEFLRTRSIGGSEIGEALGHSRWGSPGHVYDRVYEIDLPIVPSPPMLRGIALEAVAAEMYQRETGRLVAPAPVRVPHHTHKFLHSSADRFLLNEVGAPNGVLEIKVVGDWSWKEILYEGMPKGYVCQLQHYLDTYQFEEGVFAVLNYEQWQLLVIPMARDPLFITEMHEQMQEFWNHYVVPQQRPLEYPSPVPLHIPTAMDDQPVVRDDMEWVTAVTELRVARERRKAIEAENERCEDNVKALMGETISILGGGAKVTWKEQAYKSLDEKTLATEHPEIDLSQYERRKIIRVFRPTFR